jgi:arsenite methyltransferase
MVDANHTSAVAGPSLKLDDEALAQDYDRISAQRQFVSGQYLVKQLAIAAGERVLDVGCGTGLLCEYIADLTGPTGHVLGIDPLPLRIKLAQARARVGLEFRVGDAYDLGDFPTASLDVICLNAVFHWLPEKSGPLREFARLLRRSGRLGISTRLGHRDSSLREALTRVMAQPPFNAYPYPRTVMVEPITERLVNDLLLAAGFAVARLEVRETVRKYQSAEEVIRFSEASSFGNLFAHLPPELKPDAREQLTRALDDIARSHGLGDVRLGLIAIGVRR